MKRKKAVLMTAIAITSIIILGGCEKSTEDMVAKADTEEVLTEELEEIETETEGYPKEVNVNNIPGVNSPDLEYEEKWMQFAELEEPLTYYVKRDCEVWRNPNMCDGNLVTANMLRKGDEIVITHTSLYIAEQSDDGRLKKGDSLPVYRTEWGSYILVDVHNLTKDKSEIDQSSNNDTSDENTNQNTDNNEIGEAPADDNIGFDGETLPDIPMESEDTYDLNDPEFLEAVQGIGNQTIR